MKAPDKIYVTPNFNRRWFTKEIDDESTEYLRKDALLEWAKEQLAYYQKLEDVAGDPVRWGQRNTFQQVIDKITSL